jgi:hypothetical protein
MWVAFRILSLCVLALSFSSCAALYNIDDPIIGVIAKNQLPAFQKSVRCELITYFEIDRERERLFNQTVKTDRLAAIENYSYFGVDQKLFGALELDLKVVDTAGLPSTAGSNISYKYQVSPPVGTATHSKTDIFMPSFTDQNTYEWQWWYIIPQNAKLYGRRLSDPAAYTPQENDFDQFQCYRALPANDLEGLASGKYPEYELFTRIRVNGGKPFAGWLQENASVMGTAFYAENLNVEKAEHIIPVQMYYNFMIQVSGGLNASFSLVAPHWAPFAPVATISQQQTNNLQVWLNGPDAALAAAAKSGSATAGITPANNIARAVPLNRQEAPAVPYGFPCTPRGCLLAPLPLNGPSATPNTPPP